MLKNIPTHVIAGPLGAGKTSLIRNLLAQRPAHERWAVLINEFGLIGLDAALLSTDDDGVALGEVAGGCLCCVNGVPFQVGLSRLLRQAKPDRLLIEPSGLGHPLVLLEQLREIPWAGVLAVQEPLLVLDAQALAAGIALPESQQATLGRAGLLLLNKAEGLDDTAKVRIQTQLPARPIYWTRQGALPLAELPGFSSQADSGGTLDNLPTAAAPLPQLWRSPNEPICQNRLALASESAVRAAARPAVVKQPTLAPRQAGAAQQRRLAICQRTERPGPALAKQRMAQGLAAGADF